MSRILVVVDARHETDKSFFAKNIIQEITKNYFEYCQFLFILQDDSFRNFLDQGQEIWVAEKNKSLNEFLVHLKNRAQDFNHVFFMENELFPNAAFFDQLSDLKANQILLPERAIVLEHNAYIAFDQKDFPVQSLKTKYFFCVGFPSKLMSDWDLGQGSVVFDDLCESVFQLCYEHRQEFVFAKEGVVFAHAVSESYHRARGLSFRMGYFAKTLVPAPPLSLTALEKFERYKSSKVLRPMTTTPELKRWVGYAGGLDPRWQRIGEANPCIYEYPPPFSPEDEVYFELCSQMANSRYVIVLHHLRRGGAEKEAILHLNAYCRLYPDRKVSLVLTLPVEPDLEWQLPEAVQIVELAKMTAQLPDPGIKNYLLFRALDQVGPEIIHTKCSAEGWSVFENFGRQLAVNSKLWGSLYCVDYKYSGIATSYAFQHLFKAAEYLDSLFLDNEHFLEQLKRMVPLKRSCKLFYPVDEAKKKWTAPSAPGPLKVLWCARLCFQKDLTTLLGAAWLFPEMEFHVFGEIWGEEAIVNQLNKLANVKMWGAFDSIEHIDIEQYNLFLYTSYWDGLPNILLEIGSLGMPILSPRVCGIPELLDSENSFLYDDLTELSKILENWKRHSSGSLAKAQRLQKDISQKHNWNQFLEKCRELYV